MRLANRSRVIIALCMAFVGVMLLFPPWTASYYKPALGQIEHPAGYSYVFDAPNFDVLAKNAFGNVKGNRSSIKIDLARLLVQCLAVFSIGGGISMVMTAWGTWRQKQQGSGQGE